MGFVRTVAQRQIAKLIEQRIEDRRRILLEPARVSVIDGRQNPERAVMNKQKVSVMKQVLTEMTEKDRDILTRFYLGEQTQEQICEEMDLDETQFRLLKSRAKARFGELGKKKLSLTMIARQVTRFHATSGMM